MRTEFEDRVIRCVEAVPAGRVVTYGDVAHVAGGSAQAVGNVMARYMREGIPWWRVVRSDGTLAEELVDQAVPRWREERIGVTSSGRGVLLDQHRFDLSSAAADLPKD